MVREVGTWSHQMGSRVDEMADGAHYSIIVYHMVLYSSITKLFQYFCNCLLLLQLAVSRKRTPDSACWLRSRLRAHIAITSAAVFVLRNPFLETGCETLNSLNPKPQTVVEPP